MNKLEAAYAAHLDQLKRTGEITEFYFEKITLVLAPRTRYTPDFLVELPDGAMEFHETKGGLFRDDAKVKLKVAAALFPAFPFKLVRQIPKKDGGGWQIEEVG
jgi:hypothetical protein